MSGRDSFHSVLAVLDSKAMVSDFVPNLKSEGRTKLRTNIKLPFY